MFEDSLLESTGRIRTRSRYFAIGSFGIQALLLTALAIYPFLHPATLPRQTLAMILTAPPVPAAPARLPQAMASVSRPQTILAVDTILAIPSHIPHGVSMRADAGPPPTGIDSGFGSNFGAGGNVLTSLGTAPSAPAIKPAPPKAPVPVSSGVATGQLLAPIQPEYPAIAKAARIQGTVTVQAIISKTGAIEQLRVLSGPPMLQRAATEAIQRARYRPFLLNGEPVAVETTLQVIFHLGE